MQTPTEAILKRIYEAVRPQRGGAVASYIPELSRADPEHFGISVASADGHLYELGDTRIPFTIQSISKPFVYGFALEEHGLDAVHQRVGCEPSGEAFNELSLEQGTFRPFNPMINAGAIACTALVPGDGPAGRLQRILDMFGRYTGRLMSIDVATFESERATGDNNRRIAGVLREKGIIAEKVEESLDLYFRQCSVLVTCTDLALIAATLANRGRQPQTGVQAIREDLVEKVLSVMTSCGMYDFSGSWAFRIGMPAKSGVGGGVIAVLPGQLGIGVFSPPLDDKGNSVRGIAVCEELSRRFHLHFLRTPSAPRTVIRSRYTLAEVRSKRRRPAAQETRLRESGARAHIYELQGRLMFSAGEVLLRDIAARSDDCEALVLDVRRLGGVEEAAADLLAMLLHDFFARERRVGFAHLEPGSPVHERIQSALEQSRLSRLLTVFRTTDEALEWCEEILLRKDGFPAAEPPVEIGDQEILQDLGPEDLSALVRHLERIGCGPSTPILRRGDPAGGLFFIESGLVAVRVPLENGQSHRIAMLGPGKTFGEMSLLDEGVRSADVIAETDVVCHVLSSDRFRRLEREAPRLVFKLVRNIARDLAGRLRQSNEEVATLSR